MTESFQIDTHIYTVFGDALIGTEYPVSFVGSQETTDILAEEYEQINDCHLQYLGVWREYRE